LKIRSGSVVVLAPAINSVTATSPNEMIAAKIAQIFDMAGVPKGLVNAVSGSGGVIGDILVSHPKVNMITFTGSTEVGRHINTQGSAAFKKIALEMGGKSSMIVLKDVDVAQAAATAAFGIFFHSGQVCMANSRIVVESEIYDAFVEELKKAAEAFPIGSADNKDSFIGPIITAKQVEKIDAHVKDAVAKGARLITGGTYSGQFYVPTILTDVTPSMMMYYEETFGPVVAVYKADSLEAAIELANDTSYGLSGSVLGKDITRCLKAAHEMETGMVHINDAAIYAEENCPFGGVKESGTGREGGKYSIEEFTEYKWITVNMPQ